MLSDHQNGKNSYIRAFINKVLAIFNILSQNYINQNFALTIVIITTSILLPLIFKKYNHNLRRLLKSYTIILFPVL